jgi:hypothetical protein
MAEDDFALFIDVMGVQQQLTRDGDASQSGFSECRERLEYFHRDLNTTLENELLILFADSLPQPHFVAEFSDSAYVVSDHFATVALAGVVIMRKALRHSYPLRGGIGVGSFSHETSGVRTIRREQVWSTSSFLGSAIVTAFQAERSVAAGMRIFMHPTVLTKNEYKSSFEEYAISLSPSEATETSSHEICLWRNNEAPAAVKRLQHFRDKQDLDPRVLRHYQATSDAYERFGKRDSRLPRVPPAFWVFRDP